MDEIKLQLKDIAGYLPYGLKVEWSYNNYSEVTIDKNLDASKFTHIDTVIHNCYKPILRPMSDITEKIIEVEYNEGKPFTPLIEIAYACYPNMVGWRIDDEGNAYTRYNGRPHWVSPEDIELATFEVFDLLNQWHFDYRGLIAKGLAIDINTIKSSNYGR